MSFFCFASCCFSAVAFQQGLYVRLTNLFLFCNLSEIHRLNFLNKYCEIQYAPFLLPVIELMEELTKVIAEREKVLKKIQKLKTKLQAQGIQLQHTASQNSLTKFYMQKLRETTKKSYNLCVDLRAKYGEKLIYEGVDYMQKLTCKHQKKY